LKFSGTHTYPQSARHSAVAAPEHSIQAAYSTQLIFKSPDRCQPGFHCTDRVFRSIVVLDQIELSKGSIEPTFSGTTPGRLAESLSN